MRILKRAGLSLLAAFGLIMTFCAIMIADFSGAKDVPLSMWPWMPIAAFGFFKLQGSESNRDD